MADRYRVDDILQHTNGGGRWKVTAALGGEHEDYVATCIEAGPGSQVGREASFHREYLERSFVIESGPGRLRSTVIHVNAETGEEIARREMGPQDDYVVVLGPEFHLAYVSEFPTTGTTQLTIKRAE